MSTPKLLHTMVRVGNVERSIQFYCEGLGMRVLRKSDYPEDKFTLIFLGYGTELSSTVLELTYNYGVESYTHGESYGHICIGVDDIHKYMDKLTSDPFNAPVKYYDKENDSFMAFVKDPDGYEVELLNKKMMYDQAVKEMTEQGTMKPRPERKPKAEGEEKKAEGATEEKKRGTRGGRGRRSRGRRGASKEGEEKKVEEKKTAAAKPAKEDKKAADATDKPAAEKKKRVRARKGKEEAGAKKEGEAKEEKKEAKKE